MAESGYIEREWVYELLPHEVRVRCRYKRQARLIAEFTVQLEIQYNDYWRPIVRFDNAHGFCHRDDMHFDGSQSKTVLMVGDVNETFTKAIEEMHEHWETHRNRFVRESKS